MVFALFCLAASSLLSCTAPRDESIEEPVQGPVEEKEVEAVARGFLEALSATDTAALRSFMAPNVGLYSVRPGPGGPVLRQTGGEEFLASLGAEDQILLERMWDPTVLVGEGVAVVWTPYDFFLNGEFSHCGIDVFTLLKGEHGWRVTGVTYNVVRDECPPSPLGPPGG
jgi:hypothetical protein